MKPSAPLTCDECGHTMYAKKSLAGLQFFAHAPGAPTRALALEWIAHHLLKLELATAARDAGAHAELQAPKPHGTWRADVLVTEPDGAWKTALEAQLAPITEADITARTERMRVLPRPGITRRRQPSRRMIGLFTSWNRENDSVWPFFLKRGYPWRWPAWRPASESCQYFQATWARSKPEVKQ
ncbi:competence protein CoiA family protein [Streptomyces violaceus]|uniref:Competence protein CoiA nuclease-like domain-containing protein n=1 Tax=Streptomyces violaceus TaxID=1936 RepID=A0ABY9U0U3_STRVL|nr:hypothetical protein [Streptomyces janthinus]WND15965.1 hypothetical protein RI060_00695 [Streptomyces janthinus]